MKKQSVLIAACVFVVAVAVVAIVNATGGEGFTRIVNVSNIRKYIEETVKA